MICEITPAGILIRAYLSKCLLLWVKRDENNNTRRTAPRFIKILMVYIFIAFLKFSLSPAASESCTNKYLIKSNKITRL